MFGAQGSEKSWEIHVKINQNYIFEVSNKLQAYTSDRPDILASWFATECSLIRAQFRPDLFMFCF